MTIAKRILGVVSILVGAAIAAVGLWAIGHVGTSGTARFMTTTQEKGPVVVPPSVSARLTTPATVTVSSTTGSPMWVGQAGSADAAAALGKGRVTTITGVDVGDWRLTSKTAGEGELGAPKSYDIWRSSTTGDGSVTVEVPVADNPATLVFAADDGGPVSVSVSWTRGRWFGLALAATIIGSLLGLAGLILVLAGLVPASMRSRIRSMRASSASRVRATTELARARTGRPAADSASEPTEPVRRARRRPRLDTDAPTPVRRRESARLSETLDAQAPVNVSTVDDPSDVAAAQPRPATGAVRPAPSRAQRPIPERAQRPAPERAQRPAPERAQRPSAQPASAQTPGGSPQVPGRPRPQRPDPAGPTALPGTRPPAGGPVPPGTQTTPLQPPARALRRRPAPEQRPRPTAGIPPEGTRPARPRPATVDPRSGSTGGTPPVPPASRALRRDGTELPSRPPGRPQRGIPDEQATQPPTSRVRRAFPERARPRTWKDNDQDQGGES